MALACGLFVGGCTTVVTVSQPRNAPLIVARTGGEALLSWQSRTGEWYTLLYADGAKTGVDWLPLPGAERVAGNGQELRMIDHPPANINRYYRLMVVPSN